MRPYLILLALAASTLTACNKEGPASNTPAISFIGMTPNTVSSGSSKDTVNIVFNVIDGDGDLGNDPASTKHDIYLKDSRETNETPYFFPTIPSDALIPGEGIKAVCTLKVYAALFLLLRPDHPNGDTLDYDIYVLDKAGNKSNVIKTPKIFIN